MQFKHCFTGLDDLKASDFCPEIVIVCVKTYSLPRVCDELRDVRPAARTAEECHLHIVDERHGKSGKSLMSLICPILKY